jgi:DNA-binding MarR family transcriptional regulator
MTTPDLTAVLLQWISTFIRLSLHDFNRYTRSVGLSLAQMNVLMHLYYRGPSEISDFRDMMQITPAGASQMIERMVQQGMVRRSEVPGDRRVRLVSLTEQGRQVVMDSITARQAWTEQLVASLSPEESTQVRAALLLLNDRAAKFGDISTTTE